MWGPLFFFFFFISLEVHFRSKNVAKNEVNLRWILFFVVSKSSQGKDNKTINLLHRTTQTISQSVGTDTAQN